ncbi:PP2C family protein-serine/threonine phosphatase [Cellulomonas aerilata]|uniref:Serine/threonine phosphatase n=1 Tax=Cellulomonas aerilata TaxID=515326 RepID=A0A512DGG9_9CELL|nr:SpoIIE family protein phosphatase [Cellulomonas aerilata]GEO35571.1 serine/threonine phosphatase [Cellulomonas aerilata]
MTASTTTDQAIRVLLVEDDDGDALLVEELFADAGIAVDLVHVRSLDAAVHALDADCVLLDLGLPDAMGLGGLERLLDAGAPAVVVLTGLSGTDLGLQALAAGAQDYLVKGEADGGMLGRSVRYAVQRQRSEATERELYRSQVRAEETSRLERALLPTPVVVDPWLEVGVGYQAGRDGLLGGDFYDVVERPDGSVLAIVGDVCGHGPDAAALGATLRTAWRTLVLAGADVEQILPLLERVLDSERWAPEIFTTASMLAVAPDRRSADLYLAGHPVPLLLGPPSRLVPPTMRDRALGVPVPGTWRPQRLELSAPWRLMMYTDGIIEATVVGGRLGKDGLVELVDHTLERGTASLVDEVIGQVRRRHGGQLADDAAAVVLGWHGSAR